jgi:hypothetical protein
MWCVASDREHDAPILPADATEPMRRARVSASTERFQDRESFVNLTVFTAG